MSKTPSMKDKQKIPLSKMVDITLRFQRGERHGELADEVGLTVRAFRYRVKRLTMEALSDMRKGIDSHRPTLKPLYDYFRSELGD